MADGAGLQGMAEPPKGESRTQRALRAQHQQIYNRLRSIRDDALQVERVVRQLEALLDENSENPNSQYLAVFGNRRCGEWYVGLRNERPFAERKSDWVHFKSADGHHAFQGEFSLQRVNAQLIACLSRRKAAVVVDATRRGKRFPDALSRTLPAWAAVVNRVYLLLDGASNWTTAQAQAATQLFVPEACVSRSEADQIASHVLAWAHAWVNTAGEQFMREFISCFPLDKPLRVICVDTQDDVSTLPLKSATSQGDIGMAFLPCFALSASRIANERDLIHVPFSECLCEDTTVPNTSVRALSLSSQSSSSSSSSKSAEAATWASSPASFGTTATEDGSGSWIEFDRDTSTSAETAHEACACGSRFSYEYVQGAADDEQAWNLGLTSALFWKKHPETLRSPNQCESVITSIVEQAFERTNIESFYYSSEARVWAPLLPSNLTIASYAGMLCASPAELAQYDRVVVLYYEEPTGLLRLINGGKLSSLDRSKCSFVHICDKRRRPNYRSGLYHKLTELMDDLSSHSDALLVSYGGADLAVGLALVYLGACRRTHEDPSKWGLRAILLRLLLQHPELGVSRSILKQVNRFCIEDVPGEG
ncbi:tRNA A64-2'-O-ribosylphosphate transferase [Porphyridium purpureum]|uniref:tRNA A64-2'-O-ribosylphosphate transferase n=1 Tax=Porphyridium purpureum TaxID=35688 RepID=A0A5J4Z0G9_PORPP|nr:tRNA A64-2'-O-ribosylphosphate transferase [Porphyridium purpureum]|eukprot:POR4610..scf208_2